MSPRRFPDCALPSPGAFAIGDHVWIWDATTSDDTTEERDTAIVTGLGCCGRPGEVEVQPITDASRPGEVAPHPVSNVFTREAQHFTVAPPGRRHFLPHQLRRLPWTLFTDGGPALCGLGHKMEAYHCDAPLSHICDACSCAFRTIGALRWHCAECRFDQCDSCAVRAACGCHWPPLHELAKCLEACDWRTRQAAVAQIVTQARFNLTTRDEVRQVLVPKLSHRSWRVRATATEALRRFADLSVDWADWVISMAFDEAEKEAADTGASGPLSAAASVLRAAVSTPGPLSQAEKAGAAARHWTTSTMARHADSKGRVGPDQPSGRLLEAGLDLIARCGTSGDLARHVSPCAEVSPMPAAEGSSQFRSVKHMAVLNAAVKLATAGSASSSEADDARSLAVASLKDINPAVRREALHSVEALGFNAISEWKALTELLKDPEQSVRREAAGVILRRTKGGMTWPYKASPENLEALKTLVKEPADWWVWNTCTALLAEWGLAYCDWGAFLVALNSFSMSKRSPSSALRRIFADSRRVASVFKLDESYARSAVGCLSHKDDFVRQEAWKLAREKAAGKGPMSLATQLLQSPCCRLKTAAEVERFRAHARQDDAHIEGLRAHREAIVYGGPWRRVEFAVEAIAREVSKRDEQVTKEVLRWLREGDSDVVHRALKILSRTTAYVGPKLVGALLAALGAADAAVRAEAVHAFVHCAKRSRNLQEWVSGVTYLLVAGVHEFGLEQQVVEDGVFQAVVGLQEADGGRHAPRWRAITEHFLSDLRRVADSAGDLVGSPLRPGAKVELKGLRTAKHLDGQRGTIKRWDEKAGRWIVRMADDSVKMVKTINLEVIFPVTPEERYTLANKDSCSQAERAILECLSRMKPASG